MRIAIVGASGNIGYHLLAALGGADEIVAIARRPPERPTGPLADGVRWHAVDISTPGAAGRLTSVFSGCDAVVHLAWAVQPSHAPDRMHATNVDGSRNVFAAARDADVPALVHSSSVGTYSPAADDSRQDESWPAGGVEGSLYSRQKAAVERILDRVEAENPQLRVARIRPAISVSGASAASQARNFLGPLVPRWVIPRIPAVPALPGLRLQVVHSEDAAAAFVAALRSEVRGAVNVAGEPVLTPEAIADVLGARVVPYPLPTSLATAAVQVAWLMRLLPIDAGWLRMGLDVPLMDTTRARRDLGWVPRHDARDTLREAMEGMARGTGAETPVLRPATSVVRRLGGMRRDAGVRRDGTG